MNARHAVAVTTWAHTKPLCVTMGWHTTTIIAPYTVSDWQTLETVAAQMKPMKNGDARQQTAGQQAEQ